VFCSYTHLVPGALHWDLAVTQRDLCPSRTYPVGCARLTLPSSCRLLNGVYPLGDRLKLSSSDYLIPMGKFSPRRPLSPSDIPIPRAQKPSAYEDNRVPVSQTPSGHVYHVLDTTPSALRGFNVLREKLPQHLEIRRLDRLENIDLSANGNEFALPTLPETGLPLGWTWIVFIIAFHRNESTAASTLEPPPEGYVALSTELLCPPTPWVSGQWREGLPVNLQVKHQYPTIGDLPNTEDVSCALDSTHALWASRRRWGTGDPGRLLQEIHREHLVANSLRLLVPWKQIEFNSLSAEARSDLYVSAPTWWFKEEWVSSHMFVALPPIVTYRASRLLQRSNLSEVETEYWWRVFEAEWVVMFFCRFCADMSQRRLMWRLTARTRM
jgi:hypothetical protein